MATVLMLSWEYPPMLVGGLARHVHALARALTAQGHEVHLLTRQGPGLPAEAVEDGIHVVRVAPYFQEPQEIRLWANHLNFGLLEAGVRLLSKLPGPVVIHAHDWLVAHAARGLKHLHRYPLVATIHATEHGRNRGIHDAGQQYINDVEWWLTYEACKVIVCSEAMRGEVDRLFGLPADKVSVIPNGIELPPAVGAGAALSREAFAAPHERLIFHLGRLVREKGAGVLLEAVARLRRRYPLSVVIGGVGPCRAELERQTAALGLSGIVRFTGWLSDQDAQALYRHADVAVVPSTYEPFGIVALEAMAAGAPLVASDVGGLREIVQHGVNGLTAAPGDPASLAAQLDRLLGDTALAAGLVANARRDVRERYTWSGIARATAGIYDQALSAWAGSDWAGLSAAPAWQATAPPR